MKSLEFNSVFVIESSRTDDKKTGTDLFNDTIKRYMGLKDLEANCLLICANSKQEFLAAFNHIKNHITYNFVNPIIHLEMHGSKEGLELANSETITWVELQSNLIELNILCENNLFLTLATCYGGYIYRAISPHLRTPFWGFVGAFEEVYSVENLINFTSFYEEFLQSLDFNKAIHALEQSNFPYASKFRFQNTEYVFNKAYANYEEKYLSPHIVEQRTNLLMAQCKSMTEFSNWSVEEIKDFLKDIMVNKKDDLKNILMNRFFLRDLFPDQNYNY